MQGVANTQTKQDKDPLTAYYRDVQQTHPLSRSEEQRLASRIQKGDVEARNRLVTANLRFALDMARRYQGRGLPLEDLISVANMGLLEAAKRYDGLSGVRFITYAVWWIRQSVLKALSGERRVVHLPGHITDLLYRIYRVSEVLQQDLERPPSAEEIASRLDVPARAVRQAIVSSQEVRSLDEEVGRTEEGAFRLVDLLEDPDREAPLEAAELAVQREAIEESLGQLKPRECEVIRRYYGLDGGVEGNLAEIGRELDLSRERVRQIRDKALSRLRQRYRTRRFESGIECEEVPEVQLQQRA